MLEKYGIDRISCFGMRLSDNGQDLNNAFELNKKKYGRQAKIPPPPKKKKELKCVHF